jgi:hypothetical protein
MDKAAQLGEVLTKLSTQEAVALARAVELARIRGKESLPTELVLNSLRPALREARAARLPDLRRLVCMPFAPFLTDREEEPRMTGRVARAAIAPWWTALQRIAGPEIGVLQTALAERFAEGGPAEIDDLARNAWAAAAGWTKSLVGELGKPRGDPALRQLFPRAGLVADVTAMATLLALAEHMVAAFAAIDQVLAAADKLADGQIVELTPEAVTVAKQHYLAIPEAHGMDSVLLALGLLNRLRRPWHILRLARALSWKQNDALLRQTEFGAVGERLIHELSQSAQEIAALAGVRGGAIDCARLAAAIADYMEESEGLLGEFGFRRDSSWGESILRTRVTVAAAVGRDFLARAADQMLARILPPERRARQGHEAEPRQPPSEAAIVEATTAARLLILLQQRGSRHGFGQPARDTIETLNTELEKRTTDLLDALRQAPGDPVIEAQLAAAAQIFDLLFEDGRGSTVTRRMRLANQASANQATA